MKRLLKSTLLAGLLALCLPTVAYANRGSGTPMKGVILQVNHSTKVVTFKQDNGIIRSLVYARRSRLHRGSSSESPAALKAGMMVSLNFHNPLFGPDFATRFILISQP